MAGKKPRTAKALAERILLQQAEHLEKKWQLFQAGDDAAALTEEEQDFLLKMKKLEQDADLQDAQIDYLENLSDSELSEFYQRLQDSLGGPSN